MSGSLKDSDPTSPVSPGSPDSNLVKHKVTTPSSLLQALSSLNTKDDSASGKMISSCENITAEQRLGCFNLNIPNRISVFEFG